MQPEQTTTLEQKDIHPIETKTEIVIEQKQKLEEEADELLNENELLNEQNTKQEIETGTHVDTFDAEVESMKQEVEQMQITNEEKDKLKRTLYDEITKKYDKGFVDTTKTVTENVADTMGVMDKVTNKRNIKNTLLWVGGAATVGWVASKWKSWFGKNKKSEESESKTASSESPEKKDEKTTVVNVHTGEEKGRWSRNWGWLVGGAGVGVAGYAFRKKLNKIPLIGGWLDKLFNPPEISFEDAFINFKSDVKSGDVEKHLSINPGISYEQVDEKTMKLKSYNKEILIDVDKRTVAGMEDIIFPNFTELLHAANMINFSAAAFQGICANSGPFDITPRGGDIEVKLLDTGDEEVVSGAGIPIGKYAGATVGVLSTIVGAIYGGGVPGAAVGAGIGIGAVGIGHMADTADALSKFCPTLNDNANKQKFRARLNRIPNLTQGKQDQSQLTESEIRPDVQKIIDEIEAVQIDDPDTEFVDHGNKRLLNAIPVPNMEDTYDIKSWNQTIRIRYKDNKVVIDSNEKLSFDLVEGIRVANLTNKLKSEYAGRGNNREPFVYRSSLTTLDHPGLYIKTKERNVNWTDLKGYYVLKEDTIKEKYPTLYKNNIIESDYIPYLHKMKNEDNKSLWQ